MPSYETTTRDGIRVFRKSGPGGDRLRAEADGLAAMAATGLVRTPRIIAISETELVTEFIPPGPATPGAWETLGEQLAALQALEQPCFGFTADNYCGDTPQPNPQMADGHAFFAEHRLGHQGRMAFDAGLLSRSELNALDAVCSRLDTLVPAQGPALLHGDLWSGNVLFDGNGQPVVIDPACYWGWPEAEIAMCALFGGFHEAFYTSWEAAAIPEPDWRERLPLYQLYHLLNHLNLFGGGYHAQVVSVVQRFS